MNVFFTSDVHFGHRNILTFCNRPFETVEEMDETIVDNWNKVVQTNDKVFHLGDWAFNNYHHIGRLKGNIISIPGNHDEERMKKILPYLPNGFTERVHYEKELNLALCHFPMEVWHRHYLLHFHGHTHGRSIKRPYRLDVGMDSLGRFEPVAYEELIEIMEE